MVTSNGAPLCFDDAIYEMAASIVDAHDAIVTGKGFDPGPSAARYKEEVERVASVLHPVFCTVYGVEPKGRFENIFDQVSTFAVHLAKDHIFPDANKRVTVVFSVAFLIIAGYKLDIPDADDPSGNILYLWIQDVVSGNKSLTDLTKDLKAWSKPINR